MAMMHNPAHPGEVLREWIPEDQTASSAPGLERSSQIPFGLRPQPRKQPTKER